ncbi:MAG: DUF5596 domain-containing protein [Clostridia bacterium]|nr:DUF5596 domain-containing protein [Clostridia bacterium]
MIEYVLSFMNELGFDKEAVASLSADIEKIYANEEAKALFAGAVDDYERDIHSNYTELREAAKRAGEIVGVHAYSAELLLFICFSKHLRELYRLRDISDRIWFDSMSDLKWKLWECKAVKGIWGSFVAGWFPGFFNLTRFALGRLQFEIVEFDGEYEKNGKALKNGDKVINVHIPRTLTPLDKESRDDAYAQAAEFFRNMTDGAPIAFVCSSWLLYPEAEKILPAHSNIRGFMADYDMIRSKVNGEGEYGDMWRLFDMDFTGDLNDYPEDSSLRRAYKKFLLDGNRTGSGYGVFFY